MILVNMANETLGSITKSEWKKIYAALYGGFEDLDEEETASEDDVEGLELTSEGYAIDDFVVDDNPGKKPRSRASSVASVDTKMAKRMTTLFNRIDAADIPPISSVVSSSDEADV